MLSTQVITDPLLFKNLYFWKDILFLVILALLFLLMMLLKTDHSKYLHALMLDSKNQTTDVLVNNAPVGIAIFRDQKIIYTNLKFAFMYGYNSADEMFDEQIINIFAGVESEKIIKITKSLEQYEQDEIVFESLAINKNGLQFPVTVTFKSKELNSERIIIGYFQDISDRIHAEEVYKLLNLAIKSISQCVTITDLNNYLIFVNQAFTTQYGYTRDEVIGKHISMLFADKNLNDQTIIEGTLNGGWQGEILNCKKDGTLFPIYLSTAVVFNEKNNPVALIGVSNDITEKKQAEITLRESEERYQTFINTHKDLIFIKDYESRYIVINKSFEKFFGRDRNEIINKTDYDLLDKEKADIFYQSDIKTLKTNAVFVDEQEVNGKNFEITKFPMKLHNGKIGIGGVVHDITARKLTEEQLKYSYSLLQATLESTVDGILVTDSKGKIIQYNKRFIEMWRIPEHIIATMDDNIAIEYVLEQLVYPEKFHSGVMSLYSQLEKVSSDILEFKDGRIFERYSKPQVVDGKFVGRVWDFHDVTAERIAKEELQKVSNLQALILDNSAVGITYVKNRVQQWANRRMAELFGYEQSELSAIPTRQLYKDDEEYHRISEEAYRKLYEKQKVALEIEMRKKDNSVFICKTEAKVLDPEKPEDGSIWIFEDITERKRAEEAIRRSEERFRQVAESAEEWIWEVDSNGLYTFSSPIVEKILGYKPEEIIGKKYFYDFFIPESKEFLKDFALNIFSQKQTITKLENPNLHKNGNIVYLETNGFPILDDDGKLIGYRGADTNITERKLMEDGLRRSERKIRSIYSAVPAGIGFENNKRFVEVNDHFCEMVGYSKEEIIEKETRVVYPSVAEFNEVTFWTLKLLEEKGTAEIETRWQKKDGTIINVLLCMETLEVSNTFAGIAFAALDISERIRSEEELKRREKEFRLIWENSVDGMRLTDENGTVTMVNESFCKLVDMKKEDIEGKSLSYIYKSDRQEHIVFQHKKRFASRTVTTNIEKKLMLWNGQEKWMHVSNTFFESSGHKLLLLAVFRDITKRKKAELALKESEERFRSLYENATIGLYRTTPEGKIILSNGTLVKMLGYDSFEELKNRNVQDSGYVSPEKRKEFKKILEEKNEVKGFETEWFRKDGSIVYIREGSKTVRNESGQIVFYDGTVEDITERKKAELALQESEERYRKLVASVPDIIIRTDLQGNILFVNDEISFVSPKISVDSVLGKNMLSFVIDEDKKTACENMKLMFEKPLGIKEYRIELNDGTRFVCELNGDVLRDSSNKPTGMVFVMRDITKRKEIEKELKNYRLHLEELIKNRTNELETVNKLLQEEILKQIEAEKKVKEALEKEKELNYLKTKFISIASHEFRTPLTTVLSSTELLERYGRTWETEKYKKQIERIKKSVNYLTHLMDDVLIISRTDSGKATFNPKPIEFKKFCHSVVDEMRILLTEKQELEFSYSVDKNILFVDEKLLRHILNNVLSNAIKYSIDGGKILFGVTLFSNELQFIISDSGIGIPEEDQANLFEPFNRGKNVKDIHGTGLGMSIVKRSVELHKGTISFESKVGIGTTFNIKIPI